jgi:hypothetical protein
MPDAEYEARRALLDLVERLGSLETWLPEGSLGESEVFRPEGARLFVSRYHGQADLPRPEATWPLAEPLAGIGESVGSGFRCVGVTGSDWADVLEPVARTADQLTPWTSEARRYAIAFRPLLPDERDC